ncbi:MAG: hypothetical protein FJX80_10330 [Bacteroidetes bacterium]|nr:hypothetical protein [Bacteroidota bacterium]
MDKDKEKITDEEFESVKDNLKTKLSPELIEMVSKFSEDWKKFEQYNETEFNRTKKAVKRILKRNSLILPENWRDAFIDWYMKGGLSQEEKSELDSKPLVELLRDHTVILKWAKQYTEKIDNEVFRIEEKSEKLKNLPHKLCLLEDLGILDLIEERFQNKYYQGKARETDKARLLASLFEIDDHEKVRQALKNKDYLSGKAKSNAIQTLKNHGLDSKKLRD